MKDDICEKTDGSESVSTEVTQTTSSRADPSRDVTFARVQKCGTVELEREQEEEVPREERKAVGCVWREEEAAEVRGAGW